MSTTDLLVCTAIPRCAPHSDDGVVEVSQPNKKVWYEHGLNLLLAVAGVVGALGVIGAAITYNWSLLRKCFERLSGHAQNTVGGANAVGVGGNNSFNSNNINTTTTNTYVFNNCNS